MRGKKAPKLWMQETADGFGSRMHNIIALMAFAAKHQMNFGGIIGYTACNEKHFDNTHGEDIERLVKGVLGLDDPYDIHRLRAASPPPCRRHRWSPRRAEGGR